MVFFSLLAACALITGAFTAPAEELLPRGAFPNPVSGSTEAASYYSFWQEGSGSHACSSGSGGSYNCKWSGGGGFVAGKGWTQGGSRYEFIELVSEIGSIITLPQSSKILRHLHPHRTWLPLPLRLDQKPPHRILHRRFLRPPHAWRTLDQERKLHLRRRNI